MKKKITTGPADAWLDRLVHHSPEFQAKVDEELAAINVAQDLVALREARGLSQRQLAEQLGVTQSAIAQLESAEPRNLELLTLVRAATALGGRVDVSIRARSTPRRRAVRRPRKPSRTRAAQHA
ncbi:MAG: XRE family transcriptional regulator [Acidobacteria bacterium]|nr:XRE family transcriptional regulator [Acidobacteriota bacterium]